MGNKMCCQNTSVDVGNITESRRSNQSQLQSKINQFMARNPNIKRILEQYPEKANQNTKQKVKFLSVSREYTLPEGTFIGVNHLEKNMRNGFGIMLYNTEQYYEGQWEDDLRNGKGLFINEGGELYCGQWSKDVANGHGIYTSQNPFSRYEGQWLEGSKNGTGEQTYDDQSKYEGDFCNGEKEGHGKITYADGTFYEGDFKANTIEGEGKYVGKSHTYEGGWKAGKMNGAGKSEWFNESGKLVAKYIGEYRNGIKEGFGEYTDSKGVTYKANWRNGQINQKGPIVTQRKMI